MGVHLRSLLSALALLAFSAAPIWAQAGSITGRLTDAETGSPLASARVDATSGGRVVASSFSGQDGSYRVADMPAGSYTVVITLIGYETHRVEGVRVAAGQAATVSSALTSVAFRLNPIVVSASRRQEKALEAPATVAVVDARVITERPVLTPVDHLRSVPGMDIMTHGLQSANIVARGFNNIFSTTMHTLTDNRIASVPSLRVNLMHFVPANDQDVERMEVVLGPGSALYGPNTANGVLHIITKSPLDHPGTTVSVAGGDRSVFQGNFRTAHMLNESLGFKLSGQYMQGTEWRFEDPVEAIARQTADNSPGVLRQQFARAGIPADEIDLRLERLGIRDFDVQRWGLEARADWRSERGHGVVLSTGRTMAAKGIELTGIGAAQVKDWTYAYYQARFNKDRLFAQAYFNTSDAGDTYLLRDGATIVDDSKVFVAQLQHGATFGDRQNFTYGVDFIRTMPDTKGTINGANEDDDEYSEFGAYLQSETALSSRLNLVLAGRYDTHEAIDEAIFSPRAAIVWKPREDHNVRLTYNRAFSTPVTFNLFLDINSGAAPDPRLAALGFNLRAQGTTRDGISLHNSAGGIDMRSPFTPAALGGPAQLLPGDANTLAGFWQAALKVLEQQAAAAGQPLPPQLVGYMRTLTPTGGDLGIAGLDLNTRQVGALSAETVRDVPALTESRTSTLELGYKGILGERLLLAADAWVSERHDFISDLRAQTPLVLYNGQQLAGYLIPRLRAIGVSQAQATAIATSLASIPLAVVSSEEVNAIGADILASYRNFGSISLYGADIAATALLTDQWNLELSGSWVSDDAYRTEGQFLGLNAPKKKGSVALSYRGAMLNGQVRARYTAGFPVSSQPFVGLRCIDPSAPNECVKDYTLLDLTLGYRLPMRGTSVQLNVTNLLDEDYRSFVGVPAVGRFAMLRLKYDF